MADTHGTTTLDVAGRQVAHAVTGGIEIRNLDDLARLSKLLAQSGFFGHGHDMQQLAAQAGVKVLAGLEMGFKTFASMTGIHIIEGKPTIGANLMAAAVRRHPRYDYKVDRLDNEGCVLTFYEDGVALGESSFTLEDARKAGIAFKSRSGGDTNWAKFPRNMCFSRSISNGVRWYTPDVFDGTTVYTPDELGYDLTEDGQVIEYDRVSMSRTAPSPSADDEAPDLYRDVELAGAEAEDAAAPPDEAPADAPDAHADAAPASDAPATPSESDQKPAPEREEGSADAEGDDGPGSMQAAVRWALEQKTKPSDGRRKPKPLFADREAAMEAYQAAVDEWLEHLAPDERPASPEAWPSKMETDFHRYWVRKIGAAQIAMDYSLPPYVEGDDADDA